MLRLLLIISLVGYVLYRLGLFKIFTHTEVRGHRPNNNFNRRPGNVNVDSNPKQKKDSNIKGGEYIDYEEIK